VFRLYRRPYQNIENESTINTMLRHVRHGLGLYHKMVEEKHKYQTTKETGKFKKLQRVNEE
jgi:hypothetical protein